jgi:UDP-3-O-[3-hydroxymyristoyl] glucosamine N-acyltransferase
MQVWCARIAEDLVHLFPRTRGDLQVALDRAATPERGGPAAIVFVSSEAMLEKALAVGAGAVVLPLGLEGCLPDGASGAFLFTMNLRLAMAAVLGRYFDDGRAGFAQDPAIDPRAFVAADAHIAPGAIVAAGAFVGPGAVIGTGAILGPGCVIEAEARVGAGTLLHALVFLGRRCQVGERCEIHPHTTIGADGFAFAQDERGHHHKIPQLGIVVIEDDVEIQANCTIDRAAFDVTRIGRGTKIDNLCHIAHNCQIGRHVILTGGFMVAGSTSLGDHCVAGGRTTVTDHVHICAGVQLGGLSAVTKDISEPGAYGGHPLQPFKAFLRTTTSIAHLPGMRKRLAGLEKRVLDLDGILPECFSPKA